MASKRSYADEHEEEMRQSMDKVKDAIIDGFTKYMKVLTASLEEHHRRLRPGRTSDAGGPSDQDMNLSPEGRRVTPTQMSERVHAGTSRADRYELGGRRDSGADSSWSSPNQSPRIGRGWRENSSSSEGRGRPGNARGGRGGRGGRRGRPVPRPAQESMVDDDWEREVEESEKAREGYKRNMPIHYSSQS